MNETRVEKARPTPGWGPLLTPEALHNIRDRPAADREQLHQWVCSAMERFRRDCPVPEYHSWDDLTAFEQAWAQLFVDLEEKFAIHFAWVASRAWEAQSNSEPTVRNVPFCRESRTGIRAGCLTAVFEDCRVLTRCKQCPSGTVKCVEDIAQLYTSVEDVGAVVPFPWLQYNRRDRYWLSCHVMYWTMTVLEMSPMIDIETINRTLGGEKPESAGVEWHEWYARMNVLFG